MTLCAIDRVVTSDVPQEIRWRAKKSRDQPVNDILISPTKKNMQGRGRGCVMSTKTFVVSLTRGRRYSGGVGFDKLK